MLGREKEVVVEDWNKPDVTKELTGDLSSPT